MAYRFRYGICSAAIALQARTATSLPDRAVFLYELTESIYKMTNKRIFTVSAKSSLATGQVFRLVIAAVMISSLLACAITPTQSDEAESARPATSMTGLDAAVDLYNSGNYSGAVEEYDNVISDESASANSHRMAHLGKALVYLGKDNDWHSIENAKVSLRSAEQVVAADDEGFKIETDLLMNAVSAVIDSESEFVALRKRSAGSAAQIASIKQERDALATERDALLEEQVVLNEALEKLKQLTLGN